MTTVNRVLSSIILLGVIGCFVACEKPLPGTPAEPVVATPQLISFFDGLEHTLYYADEYWEDVVSDAHIMDMEPTAATYAGYNLAGAEEFYHVQLIPVSIADLDALSEERLKVYSELLIGLPLAELASIPAPSRRHIFMRCGDEQEGRTTCQDLADSTSIQRVYNAFKRCEVSTSSNESCTEFNVVWYTQKHYDQIGCGAPGQVTKTVEERDWRCYQ